MTWKCQRSGLRIRQPCQEQATRDVSSRRRVLPDGINAPACGTGRAGELSVTGLLLGNCGVFAGRTGPDEPEIGYEIRRSRQGQGLAGEAAQAVLDEALSSGIPRIWATIRPHNTASQRVATRIGMQHHSVGTDSKGRLLYLVSPRHRRQPGERPSRIRDHRIISHPRPPDPNRPASVSNRSGKGWGSISGCARPVMVPTISVPIRPKAASK